MRSTKNRGRTLRPAAQWRPGGGWLRVCAPVLAVCWLLGCSADSVVAGAGDASADTGPLTFDTVEKPPEDATPGAGADTGADDVAPLVCEGPILPALCPCTDDAQCETACVTAREGRVCVGSCGLGDPCPTGWGCVTLSAPGGELVTACVDRLQHLCRPCDANSECSVPGSEGADRCVDHAGDGSFCGVACAAGCPTGTVCDDGQCVPESFECECTTAFEGTSTACSVTNAAGTCQGTRRCESGVLTACDAETPEPERCNGADDDCDGLTDEHVGGACVIGNAFGSCPGVVVCDPSDRCDGPTPAEDVCNGADDDCSGVVDDGAADTDLDQLADCVDPDDENDGWGDEEDVCPTVADPDQKDTDGDGLGDACDPDDDNDEALDEDDCAPKQPKVGPGAQEACDGVDNDCDLETDEAACDDGSSCTDDVCDPADGCSYLQIVGACDDGDPCTSGDNCSTGTCAGDGLGCNDQNPCTSDSCAAGVGCLSTPNSLPCSDGDACTEGDLCAGGACQPGGATACNDGAPCTIDGCQPGIGCTTVPGAGPCDDGNACTEDDLCAGATCSGSFVSCVDGNPCTKDSCDPVSGCVNAPAPDGGVCSDGTPCTTGDACASGQCVGEDAGLCACSVDADCADLEDGDLCNGTLFCDKSKPSWVCAIKASTVITCPLGAGVSPGCAAATCEPTTGECSVVLAPADTPCADGSSCTHSERCTSGQCVGVPVVCDDHLQCTTDACQHGVGCVYTPLTGAACDDGDQCTVGDLCSGGFCEGAPRLCTDNNPCTADACEPAAGCVALPISGGTCNDDSLCTSGDVCVSGSCVGATVSCGDGNLCNGLESCSPAKGCVPGAPLACGDGVPCTVDTCHPGVGCLREPSDAACADGHPCTIDKCDNTLGCIRTPDHTVCADNNPCTTNTCVIGTGCTAAPISSCGVAASITVRFSSVATTVEGAQGSAALHVTPSAGGPSNTQNTRLRLGGLVTHHSLEGVP